MGRIIAVGLCLALVTFVCGCAETVSKNNLAKMVKQQEICSECWVWYVGSDAKYHYYKNEELLSSKTVRVPLNELSVKDTFSVTNDRSMWIRIYSLEDKK